MGSILRSKMFVLDSKSSNGIRLVSRRSCLVSDNGEVMVYAGKFSYESYKLGVDIFETVEEAQSAIGKGKHT